MTAPRQVLPGTTYLTTRRCAQREFLLKPSKITNEVVLYLLAVASHRFAVQIHAFCVLSNHLHVVLTDPHARHPAFQQFLGALSARALNAALKRSEALWARKSYSAVTLAAPDDIVEKAAYTLANPVAAGLVRSSRQWPGLWSPPEQIGGTSITVRRPEHFFDPEGDLPEQATLELTVPPGFESAEEFRASLVAALERHESEARRDRRGRFLGVAAVLAQDPHGRPVRREDRATLSPRVAASDKWKRIEILGRLTSFLKAYRDALAAYLAGEDAVFPAGTYAMRIMHGVPCAAAG